MTEKELLQAVKDGKISPKDGLKLAEVRSTRLGDIVPNFTSEALECGFPSMEAHQYIMKDESNLIVMAARPGNGKTALACQIALNVSSHSRVLMFSLEMRKESLYKRLLSVVSQVPIKQLGNSKHTNRVQAGMVELDRKNFRIVDDSTLTVKNIIAQCIDENSHGKLDLVIIDYLALINVNGINTPREYSEVVWALKFELANVLKIPVVLLAQMNRSFDDRSSQFLMAKEKARMYAKEGATEITFTPPRPTMSDLAESSGVEKHADVALFLHRPHLVDKSEPASKFIVYSTKNRNGEVQDFELSFSGSMTTFYDKGPSEEL